MELQSLPIISKQKTFDLFYDYKGIGKESGKIGKEELLCVRRYYV
jgi:hypothetical protein